MKKLGNTFLSFVEEAPGIRSSVRLQMLMSFVFCGVIPAIIWGYLSIKGGALAEFPSGAAAFFLGIIGATSAAKVIQYPKEPENHQKTTETGALM